MRGRSKSGSLERAQDTDSPTFPQVPFIEYAQSWVTEWPDLRPKTLQLYKGLVRLHMNPGAGLADNPEITEQL